MDMVAQSMESPMNNMQTQGTYRTMLAQQGAIAAEGLRGLAGIAAMGGNDLSLEQGHSELTESYRLPLHPGHNPNRDDHRRANFIGSEFGMGA